VLIGGRQRHGGQTLLRVLGARHVLQSGATPAASTGSTLRLGAVADTAAVGNQERRASLLDAAVAASWAVASLQATRR
jgi:hypothetical protein